MLIDYSVSKPERQIGLNYITMEGKTVQAIETACAKVLGWGKAR